MEQNRSPAAQVPIRFNTFSVAGKMAGNITLDSTRFLVRDNNRAPFCFVMHTERIDDVVPGDDTATDHDKVDVLSPQPLVERYH